jgi:hypothetical protein
MLENHFELDTHSLRTLQQLLRSGYHTSTAKRHFPLIDHKENDTPAIKEVKKEDMK